MPKLEVVNANNVIEYSPQKANFKLKNTGGPKGEPGAQGPKGDTGPEGPAGPQGIQGEKGDKGAQGERGPQGIQGPQGPQGIQGPKGDKGDNGNTGATGPQGPQGPAGQDGADGFSPIATVTQEGLNAEISITDKDGTTTATVPGFGVQTVATLPATGTENIIYLKRTESTATGKSISVSDAVEAPLKSLEIQGNATQQTYSGKNLINTHATPDPSSNLSQAGVTYTIADDGTITTSGTSTATYKNLRFDITLPAGTYRASGCPSGGTLDGYSFDIQVGQTQYYDYGSGVIFTLSEATTIRAYAIRLGGSTGVNMNGKVFKPMITVSTAEQTYEPYVGGIPAPNPDYPQAVQTVTGENVVQICGKNLWGAEEHGSINENTGEDVWNANRWRTVGYIPVKSNTAYTLSSNASADIWYIFCFYDSGKNFISGVAVYGGSQTQTTPANCEFMRCVVCDTASIKTTERQLELGSTATTYEPYQGQSYPVNLTPNLYDYDDRKKGYYIDSNGDEVSNSAWSITDYLPVVAGNIFGCSGITNAGNAPRAAYYDSSKNLVSVFRQTTGKTYLTIPSGVAFVRFSLNGQENDLTADWYKFKFFYDLELCKIGDYQDSIYKSGDKWYLRKECGKLVVNGSETGWLISASTGSPNYYYARTNAKDGISVSKYAENYCNNLTNRGIYIQGTDVVNTDVFSLGSPSYSLRMLILGSRLSAMTTAALSTWLAANTPTIYYATATPTDTEITNEALVAQLEAILSQGYTYAGTNNITTIITAGNEQGELEIGYYNAYDSYLYVAGRWQQFARLTAANE